ncbi:MAG: hypothetical protein KDA84_20820 [Planctomycetaceae bacterium]|nr:hypothetical protein [Planctomycetaceae bacterium]
MTRIVLGKFALMLSILGAAGCHTCSSDCEVTGYCCPEIKKEKIEKKGWDVECKQICIPPIHCPCSDSCELKCGEVIAVKRLKKDKIECGEKCVVKYKLIDPCAVQEPVKVKEHTEEKPKAKEPTPVEAPKVLPPLPKKESKPSDKPETPKTDPKKKEASAMTPRSEWATQRAAYQASYESPQGE